MSTRSIVLLAVLVAIFAEFPLSSCFQWINPVAQTKVTLPTRTTRKPHTLKWEWSLGSGEVVNQAQIKRYQTNDKDNTIKLIASVYVGDSKSVPENDYFTLNARTGAADGNNGFMELVIADVTNQGNNGDDKNSPVNVMVSNYTYECEVTIRDKPNKQFSTTLIVLVIPTIITVPEDKLVTNRKIDLRLKCIADGKPTPTITWSIQSVSAGESTKYGEDLEICKSSSGDDFKDNDIGVYNCTASNEVGSVSAAAIIQYTECGTGCDTDDKIAIEMTELVYSNDYENTNSAKYKELKLAIESECFAVYSKSQSQKIRSCIVTRFRKGSVIANLKITYPDGTQEPRKPLEDAIKTGTFAGQKVSTSFVSPTSAPTQPTQPSNSPTETPTDPSGPDSGKRADSEGGLSKGAITAIVVVFSIIFVVIIVVLVVCMLKRRKSSGGKSRPPPAHTQAAPLKSQPVRDPLYDDEPDDRYNGGGPPPQYTAANYAEVRPTHAEQNESQMEWDKSVKDENEMWI